MKKYKIVYRPIKYDDGEIRHRYYVKESYMLFGTLLWRYVKITEGWGGDVYKNPACFSTENQAKAFIEKLKAPLPESYEKEYPERYVVGQTFAPPMTGGEDVG